MYWSVFSQLVKEKGAECQFSQLLLIQHLSYNIPYMMISLTELNPVLPVSMIFDSIKYSRSQWCWDSCSQVKLSSDFVWLLVYGQRHTHVFCVYLRGGAVGVSCSELRSCVKVEVAVLGSPSVRSLMVSVAPWEKEEVSFVCRWSWPKPSCWPVFKDSTRFLWNQTLSPLAFSCSCLLPVSMTYLLKIDQT